MQIWGEEIISSGCWQRYQQFKNTNIDFWELLPVFGIHHEGHYVYVLFKVLKM